MNQSIATGMQDNNINKQAENRYCMCSQQKIVVHGENRRDKSRILSPYTLKTYKYVGSGAFCLEFLHLNLPLVTISIKPSLAQFVAIIVFKISVTRLIS